MTQEEELERALGSTGFPASKIDVIATAEANGASQELIDQLQRLGAERFSDAAELRAALQAA